MSRWKHRTAVVQVGENSQEVRALTHKERMEFAQKSAQIREGKFQKHELPALVMKLGAVGLSPDDLEDMPGDLLDACVAKIMELTGLKTKADTASEDDEKKDS